MSNEILKSSELRMQKSIDSLKYEFSKIRSGRANPGLLEGVKVNCYGSETPITQVASINVEDSRTLLVNVWDKSNIAAVDKAIRTSDLGLNPMAAGSSIRVPLPPLTEERRKDMVKIIKKFAEECKISIRNARRESNDLVKKQLKSKEITEDDEKDLQDNIQKVTDKYSELVDKMVADKEKDLMSV